MRTFVKQLYEFESDMWQSGQRTGLRHHTFLLFSAVDAGLESLEPDARTAVLALSNMTLAMLADREETPHAIAKTHEQLWQESLARSHRARAREHAGLPPEDSDD